MPSDKQLRLKNALKECNERAGAHIKKYVKNNESRMQWLPTYLAECKVKLGVTTEEPAFLPKAAKRKSKKRTNDEADSSILNPPPRMSAAELRRRSVLAAQRPLEEPVEEAGLQDGATAEAGNVVDTEKDGEAEEVVSTGEESGEAVAVQPKDDSDDVPAATTDSPRQASDPEINVAEVISASKDVLASHPEASVPEITLTEVVLEHVPVSKDVEPGDNFEDEEVFEETEAESATVPMATLQEGDETRDILSSAVSEVENVEVEEEADGQKEREDGLEAEEESGEEIEPLEKVAKCFTKRSSIKRPAKSLSSSETEEASPRPGKKAKLVKEPSLARRTTTITKTVTEEFLEPRTSCQAQPVPDVTPDSSTPAASAAAGEAAGSPPASTRNVEDEIVSEEPAAEHDVEAVEDADISSARRVTFVMSLQPGCPVPEAGAGLEAPGTEAAKITPARVTRSRTKSARRSSVRKSLGSSSASKPAAAQMSGMQRASTAQVVRAARPVAASPLVRDSGFQSGGSSASSSNPQKVRSRLGGIQRVVAGPSNLINTSGLKSFVPGRAKASTLEEEEEQRAEERRRKVEKEAEVAARKAKIVKEKADDLKEKNEARARKVKEAKDKREQAVAMKEKRTEESNVKEAALKMKRKKAEERAAAEVEKAKKIVEKELAALKKDEAMQKVENAKKVEVAKHREEELARKKAIIEEQKKAAREAARAAEEAREVPAPAGAVADLNATYDMEEGQAPVPVPDANSYDMTPARHELPPAPLADQNNYGLEDLQSDEDTDDEENPRKEIPRWAEGSDLRTALLKQTYMCPDLDKLFDVIVNPNLADMFSIKRKRFDKRTSSAVWDSTPGSFMLKRI